MESSPRLTCADVRCGGALALRWRDTPEIPPRRAAALRCEQCGAVAMMLTPRMLAVLRASDGRIVRPGCGAVARSFRLQRVTVHGSVLLSDRGMVLAEMVRADIEAEQDNARERGEETDHVW